MDVTRHRARKTRQPLDHDADENIPEANNISEIAAVQVSV
jgi:hypothetical protein